MVKQDELYQLILAKPHVYSIHDFADIYEMKNSEDFTYLNQMLNKLENDFLIVRDHKDRYCDPKESGLYKGKITINRRGFGFLDLDDDHSIYIAKNDLNFAMDQDTVVVKINGSIKESPEGTVVRVLERSNTSLICTYRKFKSYFLVCDDERITQKIKVENEKAFKLVEGLKVKCQVIKYGDPLVVKIEQVIGHENDPGVDVLAVLYNYGIESEFPKEVFKQCAVIEEEISDDEKQGRIDLTNKIIVTIDGDDSKDLDDAISIEKTENGYLLGVHIADVSHYVVENSALDKEARKRGTSTYVVDRVVPMLPHVLSNGICSLNEGVERLTMSCEMEINKSGEIIDYRIFPSFIKSTARMTYNNVNKILNKDKQIRSQYADLVATFEMMSDCASKIRKRRAKNGAIDFDRNEAKIVVDKKGKVLDIKLRERGESQRIIEDFMVSANECVARHTKWLQIPSLYRIHETPMLKKIQEFSRVVTIMGYKLKGSLQDVKAKQLQQCLNSFKEDEGYPILSLLMLRCMQKARYDRECLGHFGLALEDYTHFTSPIRRYPDLIVHRMLKKYFFNNELDVKQIKKDESLMEDLAECTSVCERRSTDAEREVDDMKKAEFMKSKIGQKFTGVISSVTKFGFYVELENTVEGLVHIQDLRDDFYHFDQPNCLLRGERSNKVYKLGQSVEVQLVNADKEKREINFILASNQRNTRNKSNRNQPRKRPKRR